MQPHWCLNCAQSDLIMLFQLHFIYLRKIPLYPRLNSLAVKLYFQSNFILFFNWMQIKQLKNEE